MKNEKLRFFRLQKGFTLLELTIYIAILATILVFLAGFLWIVVFGNIKETSYEEVQQNGRFALSRITQEIRKATGINNPALGSSAGSLSLSMADPNSDPTIFDAPAGRLRMRRRGGGPIILTSDQVRVSNLQFLNLSYPGTPGIIRIEMTIEHLNLGNRIEYQASVDLKSSVSLVAGGAAP